MPPIVIPDTVQVVSHGTVLDQPWTAVYHIDASFTSQPLGAVAAESIHDIFMAYHQALATGRASEWIYLGDRVVDIRSADGPSYEFAEAVNGTGSAQPLPPDLAIVTSWRTVKRGPRYRGRTYHCGYTEDQMTDGKLTAAAQDNDEAAATALLAALDAESSALVVASRKFLTSEPVTSFVVNEVFDRQLRRRFPQ